MRWSSGIRSSPLEHPTHWLISTQSLTHCDTSAGGTTMSVARERDERALFIMILREPGRLELLDRGRRGTHEAQITRTGLPPQAPISSHNNPPDAAGGSSRRHSPKSGANQYSPPSAKARFSQNSC